MKRETGRDAGPRPAISGKDDFMKTCNKPCLANKDGKCAVEKCNGQIVTLRDVVMEVK